MRNFILSTLVLAVALPACGDDNKSNSGTGPHQRCARGTLALGIARTGEVGEGDCAFDLSSFSEGFYDSYSVALTQGRAYQVQVDATGRPLDTFVEVVSPRGAVVAESDDDFRSLDSELFLLASQTGTYGIRAGGLYADATGPYRVTVRECGATTLSSTATISGTLSASDCRSTFLAGPDSSFVDLYVLQNTGSSRTITVMSSSFVPALGIFGPLFASKDSDFVSGTAPGSPATFNFPAGLLPGSYIVIVGATTSFGATGSYTIQASSAIASNAASPMRSSESRSPFSRKGVGERTR